MQYIRMVLLAVVFLVGCAPVLPVTDADPSVASAACSSGVLAEEGASQPEFYREYVRTQEAAILYEVENGELMEGLRCADGAYTIAMIGEFERRLVEAPERMMAFILELSASDQELLMEGLCYDIAYYPDSTEKHRLKEYLEEQIGKDVEASAIAARLLDAWNDPE